MVEKFVADKSSFDLVTTKTKKGELPVETTEKTYFGNVASNALQAIDARGK